MFSIKQGIFSFLIIGSILITGSCSTNPEQNNLLQKEPQQHAYNTCMIEKMNEFPHLSIPEAKMTAHLICNMLTGYMDERYFDCLPVTNKMFSLDGYSETEKSADAVCKYYSNACREDPKNSICKKNYITDLYQHNPDINYPGTLLKRKKFGTTLLIDLVSSGHLEAAEAVIKRGAIINESMSGGWTALDEARKNENEGMIEMLMKFGAK